MSLGAVGHRALSPVQLAFRPHSRNLGTRVVNSAMFTMAGVLFRSVLTIASMAILARLLTPSDFGIIAMATVITELAAVFSNFGFGSILIQRKSISRIQMDTMHWCAMALGLVLTVLVFLLSLAAGSLFNNATVGDLLRLLALSFILEELTMVPRSLMARRMQFRLDFYVQAAMLLGRSGAAVALALAGFGVWSLAIGPVLGLLIQALAYQWLSGYWPRLRFSRSFLASTWRTNGSHFGNGILFYLNANLDTFIIGRMLGAATLGNYQNARSLTDEIRVRMVQPLQRVLFPAFSAIQADLERFQQGVLRTGRLLGFVFLPVGVGMATEAETLIRILYGDQWLAMIPLLQLLALTTGFSAVGSIANAIFNARNAIGQAFRLFLLTTVANTLFILVGSLWGLDGVVWSRVAMVPVSLFFLYQALRLVSLGWRQVLDMLAGPTLAATLMGAVMLAADAQIRALAAPLGLHLLLKVGLGAALYLALAPLLARPHLREFGLVFTKIGRKS